MRPVVVSIVVSVFIPAFYPDRSRAP